MQEHNTRAVASSIRNTLQEAQSSLNGLAQTLIQQIRGKFSAKVHTTVDVPETKKFGDVDDNEAKQNAVLHMQLEVWKQNPSWIDHPPDMKEVTYRRVLEDEGHRQLVEVEQSAIWRFLCFSGTMSIRVFVDQNRHTHSLKFYLAKEGFMKKFEGSWDIRPVYVDSPHCELLASPEDDPSCCRSRIASKVQFKQILQPILVPPPPLSWYVRGISRRQTESLIEDLQAEAKRLREGNERTSEAPQQQEEETEMTHVSTQPEISPHGHPSSSRRRRRNLSWLRN